MLRQQSLVQVPESRAISPDPMHKGATVDTPANASACYKSWYHMQLVNRSKVHALTASPTNVWKYVLNPFASKPVILLKYWLIMSSFIPMLLNSLSLSHDKYSWPVLE